MSHFNIGFDVGTYNLITCGGQATDPGGFHDQVNAYLHLKDPAPMTRNTLKSIGKPILPHGENGKDILVLGKDAIELASDFGSDVKRPMKRGCVGSDEGSYPILAAMLRGMVKKYSYKGKGVLYFSKPAEAITSDTNVELHGALLQGIFEGYADEFPEGITLTAHALNEAAAVIFSDCPDKTGLAISTGAGMVNIAYVKFGVVIFAFSISQSGDWIDEQVSKSCGMSIASTNIKKTSIDISKAPTDQFSLVVKSQYDILIRSSIEKIIKGVNLHKGEASIDKEIPIVIAGGVSGIAGFMPTFIKTFELYRKEVPLKIGEIRRAKHGVKAIAHGLFEAAKLHE